MATQNANLSSFIWSVADLLRGDYKQSEYGKVILGLNDVWLPPVSVVDAVDKVADNVPKRCQLWVSRGCSKNRQSSSHGAIRP